MTLEEFAARWLGGGDMLRRSAPLTSTTTRPARPEPVIFREQPVAVAARTPKGRARLAIIVGFWALASLAGLAAGLNQVFHLAADYKTDYLSPSGRSSE